MRRAIPNWKNREPIVQVRCIYVSSFIFCQRSTIAGPIAYRLKIVKLFVVVTYSIIWSPYPDKVIIVQQGIYKIPRKAFVIAYFIFIHGKALSIKTVQAILGAYPKVTFGVFHDRPGWLLR